MYCPRCGTKAIDSAKFCRKCGVKLPIDDAQPIVEEKDSEGMKAPPQTSGASSEVFAQAGNVEAFKEFVESQIRETTDCQTTEELLNSHASVKFVWKYIGGFAILGILLSVIRSEFGAFLLCLVFGYIIALIAKNLTKSRYSTKYRGTFNTDINTDDLLQFLNGYLTPSFPYFSKWGYADRTYVAKGPAAPLMLALSTAPEPQYTELDCALKKAQSHRLTIYIRPDADKSKMSYFCDVRCYIGKDSFLTCPDLTFSTYPDLVHTAPIVRAAMEYYLHSYRAEGDDHNVLS